MKNIGTAVKTGNTLQLQVRLLSLTTAKRLYRPPVTHLPVKDSNGLTVYKMVKPSMLILVNNIN